MRVRHLARHIGYRLGRLFTKRQTCEPGLALLTLARHAGIANSWLARCGCGHLLVPLMVGNDSEAEIAAIGCPLGHGAAQIICGCLPAGTRSETHSIH